MIKGVVKNETANGATCPASVHSEPLTTFVVIPAVDGGFIAPVSGDESTAVSEGAAVTGGSLARRALFGGICRVWSTQNYAVLSRPKSESESTKM